MDFCLKLIGKSIDAVTFDDIVTYFSIERDESMNLEFKSFNNNGGKKGTQLNETIVKSICAMLNSEGGLLIWGAPKEQAVPETGYKKCMGDLCSVNEFWERDKLINKLNDLISPLASGIKVRILGESGSYIYIFEVQESKYKPHQRKEIGAYYIRLDGQTKAAPHYFIEALYKQVKYAELEATIDFGQVLIYAQNLYFDCKLYIFNFSHYQNEHEVSFKISLNKGQWCGDNTDHKLDHNFMPDSPQGSVLQGKPLVHLS